MPDQRFHRSYRAVSDSSLVEAMSGSLSCIKEQDGLTDADLGRELGKAGEDSGRAYRTGFATMNAVSFLRGCERWNGRFADEALALVGFKLTPLDAPAAVNGQHAQSWILKAALALSVALEDGNLEDEEIKANRATLEQSRAMIDGLLSRLKPQGVA